MKRVFFLMLFPIAAQAASLELPLGADRMVEDFTPLASYAVPTAPWTETGIETEVAEGRVIREAWHVPGQATTLQLLEPLRDQLTEQGYDILFECETKACGGFDFRFETEVLPEPDMHIDLADFRFLSARHDGEITSWVTLMVSRSSSTGYIQFVAVSPKIEGEEALGTKSPDDLESQNTVSQGPILTGQFSDDLDIATGLESRGRAILADLSFETGSSRLADREFPALETLATYLRTHPARKVMLVGHTDSSGSLDANIALSRARARAVRQRLIDGYDIPEAQLEADGIGYLMPLSSNLTDEGRAANRRVEVIMISTE